MRIGIIGAGGVALAHAQAIGAHPEAVLAAVYDTDTARARALAELTGARCSASVSALLGQVDSVVVASPNHSHFAHADEAIRGRRHVLCEKPMTATIAEAEHLAAGGEPRLSTQAVGFNYRYLDIAQEVRRLLAEQTLGDVLFVELGLRRSSALSRRRHTWRDSALSNATSGALGDLGVHLIDLLLFFIDSDVDVDACRVGLRTNVPVKAGVPVAVDDDAFVCGVLRNGVHFTLAASKSSQADETGLRLRIVGTRGELSFDSRDGNVYRLRSAVLWELCRLADTRVAVDPPGEVHGWATTFHRQLADWSDEVTGRRRGTQLADIRDGLRVQRVLDRFLTAEGTGCGAEPRPAVRVVRHGSKE